MCTVFHTTQRLRSKKCKLNHTIHMLKRKKKKKPCYFFQNSSNVNLIYEKGSLCVHVCCVFIVGKVGLLNSPAYCLTWGLKHGTTFPIKIKITQLLFKKDKSQRTKQILHSLSHLEITSTNILTYCFSVICIF